MSAAASASSPAYKLILDGRPLQKSSPVMVEKAFLLPALPISEVLGGKPQWNAEGKLLLICRGDTCLPLMASNGQIKLIGDKPHLTVEKLAEIFGLTWSYDAKHRTVILKSENKKPKASSLATG